MCNEEVNLTKPVGLVSVCIVALAMFSSIGCACLYSVAQGVKHEPCDGHSEVYAFPVMLAPNSMVLGDPIDDPKPNSYIEAK